ncbi:MAG: pseudoazurin [Rhizobiales bacterium]|nr:pseudoazurin [Hyphomicrobiales bacterium]
MKKILALATFATVGALAPWASATAAEYEVQMLNKGSDGTMWEFSPAFLKIQPGDSVTFVPADKDHNSETTQDLVPEGAEPWRGKLNEAVTVTYETEGVYAYKCLPHAGLGMVGVIQVGDGTDNLDAVMDAKVPGKGKTRLADLVAQVGS